MNRLFLCAASAALLVTGCKAPAVSNAAATQAAPGNQAAASPAPVAAAPALSPNANCASDPKAASLPASAPGFDVAVTLSPLAQQTLGHAHETLCISAEFYGEVTKEGRKHHLGDEMDQVYFGGGEFRDEIAGAGTARFAVPPADPAVLQYVRDGKEQVLINVFTGRRSSQDNLITCDIFQDDVKLAQANGVKIACKMISES